MSSTDSDFDIREVFRNGVRVGRLGKSSRSTSRGEVSQELLPEGHVHVSGESSALSSISRRIVRGIQAHAGGSTRWLGDIYPTCGYSEAQRLVAQADEHKREEGLIAIIWHPEGFRRTIQGDESQEESGEEEEIGHCHIYHTCIFNGSYCRCRCLRGIRLKRRHRRRVIRSSDISEAQIAKWLQYFCKCPRRFLHLSVGKLSILQQIDQIRDLQGPPEIQEYNTDEEMDDRFFPRNDARRQSYDARSGNSQESQRTSIVDAQESGEVPGSSYRATGQLERRMAHHNKLVQVLEEFMCVPFYSTCETQAWLENPYLTYFDKADNDYKRAVSTVSRKTQHLSMKDIWQMLQKPSANPHWYARTADHYLDVDVSLKYVEDLLIWQYGSTNAVSDFLHTLYSIVEKLLPKKNTLYVTGPPNSGKTWFFDMVCAYYLNVGHVANFVRGDHFPLNDCISRRILMWNEPSIMPSAYDTVKMLTGGDPCPANIKYQGHSVVSRTPLIMTANRCVFDKSPVWTTRIEFLTWKCAPFLKGVKGYPSPKAFYLLMKKYNIIE